MRSALICFVAVVVSACASSVTSSVAVRHPLHTGTVDPNIVELGRMPRRDRATLVELTADRICVEVELYGRGARDARGVIDNYDVGLVADDDSVEQRDPTITHGPPHYASANGALFAPQSGRRQYLYFPSSVCFPNRGFVGMTTRRLRLELWERGRTARSRAFLWDLVPGTTRQSARDPNQVEGRPPEVFVDTPPTAAATQVTASP